MVRLRIILLLGLFISMLITQSVFATQVTSSSTVFLPLISTSLRQPRAVGFLGINGYITKVERSGDNRGLLADLAFQAGTHWSREEMVWDLIEPADNQFNPLYDTNIRLAAEHNLGMIGVLISTPAWARDPSCRPAGEAFFCPPADVQQFATFAAYMAERYDGDGIDDAPGSPQIAAWEIWNEPNDPNNWAPIGSSANDNARKRRYGEMLVAAYAAIKAANPQALVLTGGAYMFDGSCAGNICDGFNFFNAGGGVFQQVPAARQAFDVFATHPFAHPERPDAPNRPRVVLLEGTTRQTRTWLDRDIGRPDAPIWITELGWCTAPGNCPGFGVSLDQQANYLIRALTITQQSGIAHVNIFQLEDGFNNPNRLWSNSAILERFDGSNYPQKPAYQALRSFAMATVGATPIGIGPVHNYVYDPNNPFVNTRATYNYRYLKGNQLIDIMWRPDDQVTLNFPTQPGVPVVRLNRDGSQTSLTPVGNGVILTLSEEPIILIQGQ